jgi:hypothetical protein
MDYAASVAGTIASRIERASFSGLFTRVEIGSHLGNRYANNGAVGRS